MSALGVLLVRWLIHAVVVMVSVALADADADADDSTGSPPPSQHPAAPDRAARPGGRREAPRRCRPPTPAGPGAAGDAFARAARGGAPGGRELGPPREAALRFREGRFVSPHAFSTKR